VVCELNWKITLNSKYLNHVVRYLRLTWYVYGTCSEFNNSLSHCLSSHSFQQMLRMPFMWTNAHMNTSDHGLSLPLKGWRSCEWFDLHQKYVGEGTVHFWLELNWAGFLHVNTPTLSLSFFLPSPTLEFVYWHIVIWTCVLVLVWRTPRKFVQVFFWYTLCIKISMWIICNFSSISCLLCVVYAHCYSNEELYLQT
jgi:hypothetical protein